MRGRRHRGLGLKGRVEPSFTFLIMCVFVCGMYVVRFKRIDDELSQPLWLDILPDFFYPGPLRVGDTCIPPCVLYKLRSTEPKVCAMCERER